MVTSSTSGAFTIDEHSDVGVSQVIPPIDGRFRYVKHAPPGRFPWSWPVAAGYPLLLGLSVGVKHRQWRRHHLWVTSDDGAVGIRSELQEMYEMEEIPSARDAVRGVGWAHHQVGITSKAKAFHQPGRR